MSIKKLTSSKILFSCTKQLIMARTFTELSALSVSRDITWLDIGNVNLNIK